MIAPVKFAALSNRENDLVALFSPVPHYPDVGRIFKNDVR